MTQPIIFAALDDTLQRPEPPSLAAIRRVVSAGQLFVWVTQRSGAEVIAFNATLEQPIPFIAEGGSVVYLPQASSAFLAPDADDAEAVGDYWAISLAGPYVQARAGLRVLANELHHSLLGYGDMTIERLQKFTGLSMAAAQRAKARESSEPFITPKAVTSEALATAAEALGFTVVYGERLSYLLAEGAGLEAAITQFLSYVRTADGPSTTVGLGQWPQDQALLKGVDRAVAMVSEDAPVPTPSAWQTIPPTAVAWTEALLTLAALDL